MNFLFECIHIFILQGIITIETHVYDVLKRPPEFVLQIFLNLKNRQRSAVIFNWNLVCINFSETVGKMEMENSDGDSTSFKVYCHLIGSETGTKESSTILNDTTVQFVPAKTSKNYQSGTIKVRKESCFNQL